MSTTRIKTVAIITALISVLTFFYIKTQELDVVKQHEVIVTLQQLSLQDSLLNESVLDFKADRFSNYDPITEHNNIIINIISWLKSEKLELYGNLNFDFNSAVDQTEHVFLNKMALIEKFKSHNGILKNSLYYLPTAIDLILSDPNYARYHTDLNLLLREILLFNSKATESNRTAASAKIEKLKKSSLNSIIQISQHADTILSQHIKLQNVIDRMFDLSTKQSIDTIYQLYIEHNTRLSRTASLYRAAMYAFALLLLLYVSQLFLTLSRTMRKLEDSLNEVAFQKNALDKHAIVASISSDGIVDYVNDKFVEISQFPKEEVIGQPWGVFLREAQIGNNHGNMQSALAAGEQWTDEFKNRKKDGDHYWVDANIFPFMDKTGKPIRYVALFTDITERKLDEERIFDLAHNDSLTGLPNRASFMQKLESALSFARTKDKKIAILFLDLDNFKLINDTMGHGTGDELLEIFADHLRKCVSQTDVVSRLGGDEFTIALCNIQSKEEIESVVSRITEITKRSVRLKKKDIVISNSIGISVFPDDGNDIETLLQNADIAMYKAKSDGKNKYMFFSHELKTINMERHVIENDLRAAIRNKQFELHYQPQIESETGHLYAVEALIRWNHPEKGRVPPDQFIPILEDSGLINEVGKWVINEAISQLIAWKKLGFSLRMAVNVSAYQVRDNHLVEFISQLLKSEAIEAHELEMELTESSLLQDTDNSISILSALSDLGISLSLDDFGTGFSSLSYLKKFPIDSLKIDRSFISDLPNNQHDMTIATTILAMAKSLDLTVIAEGVETAEQLDFLRKNGCDYLQGYYISKPLPANELLIFLSESPPHPAKMRLTA